MAATTKPKVVRKGARYDSVKGPDGSVGMVRKAKPKADKRTLDRVPPEEFRALVTGLGLTQRDVADAVGRSTSLVGGWLGHTGQMHPTKEGGEKPTNPPLARPRLAEVTRQLKAHAAQKAKAAKARPVLADVTPNPKDQNAAAHAAGEARPHVPPALVEKRRREKAERVLRGGEGAAGYPD
ncbi:MAG TPA: hypothetical protein VHR55_12660 [Candidatus Limnocylindria bacterium]|nr:hypothetical protein [Candidatus Limnocylindria bacterium]